MRIDVILTDTDDLDLSTGDIRYGESTRQHQRDILLCSPGDYKQAPTVGVGSVRYLHDNLPDDYLRRVRKQLQQDGMNVLEVGYDEDKELTVDASYDDQND